jgi:signal transduction histidine kinase/AmiR/NasT family two-component response regulator
MFAAIACLKQHDLSLVAWSVLVCVISVASAFGAYRRAILTRGPVRLAWICALAMLLGSGVWATHFLAMLAYHREMRMGFGLGLTGLSWLCAIAGMGFGAAVAARSRRAGGRFLGGLICGGAVALMHFTGVAAMRLPADILWNPGLVALAVALGLAGSAAAFETAGKLGHPARWVGAAALLSLAILALHFTAMAAVTLIPDARAVDTGPLGRHELAWGVLALTSLIVMGGGGLVVMDKIVARSTVDKLREALSCTPSLLALFDADSRLVFWNEKYASALALIGLTAERGLRYRAVIEAVKGHGLPDPASALNPAALDGELQPFMAPDGRWFKRGLGATPDGGFVVLLTDVSDQTLARQAAEAATRAKTEFLANMNHEIRTPLNAVIGMAQIMRSHSLRPDQLKPLEAIEAAGQTLNGLLNHVLDLARIEAGAMDLETEVFDLAALVEAAARPYALQAARKAIGFSVVLDPPEPGPWRGDAGKLRQVLDILLSNAVKYTERGAIGLRVRGEIDGLTLAVEDTGIGIARDKRDLIFEAFYQADGSATRKFDGAGLGLAVARRLVELMGGSLTVDSAERAGSTFTVSVPFESSAQAAPESPFGAPELTSGPALQVLAAEDNPANQMVLRAVLEPFGMGVTMTANGREAVEVYGGGRYDIVLMDIQMPEMNGVEAAREIRGIERATGRVRTPILAVTANVMHDQVESYLAAGMDGAVAKPIDVSRLLNAIERALAGQDGGSALERLGAA